MLENFFPTSDELNMDNLTTQIEIFHKTFKNRIKTIPYGRLTPSQGVLLINGAFYTFPKIHTKKAQPTVAKLIATVGSLLV